MSLLEVRNLRVHVRAPLGVARAVDGVDLAVEEGESVGIVGESGSGKSLLALSILGLLPKGQFELPAGGSVRFRGEEVLQADESRLREIRGREIAMVFQEPLSSLNPVLTVGDQVGEAVRIHGQMDRRQAREVAAGLLRDVGIPDAEGRMGAFPHQLSGGMRQRAMIAMALAGQPSLLVADEPTTALDVTIQAQVLDVLKALREKQGMALLLISHDLRVVAQLCQTVFVMYAGRIVETGPTSTVLSRPKHPYTRGLLGSRLSIRDRRSRLRPIPGEVPEATSWPMGCRFHPRCSEAVLGCRTEEPSLAKIDSDGPEVGPAASSVPSEGIATGPRSLPERRRARCWFPGEEGDGRI
jgi:oligopeptide/dipeptide ABC transporter ATP-binding protein